MSTAFGVMPRTHNSKFFPASRPIVKDIPSIRRHNESEEAKARRAAAVEARKRAMERLAAERYAKQLELIARRVQVAIDSPVHRPVRTIAMREIVAEVAAAHKVAIRDIMSGCRHVYVVVARHEAWWRCRNETDQSYPTIGRFFGKDHTTILHGCRMHEARLAASQSPKAEGEG